MHTWHYTWDCQGKSSIRYVEEYFHRQIGLELKKKSVKRHIWGIALCGAEVWILREEDMTYLGNSEMWCCRRMEKISWTDRVRNEEVLHRGKSRGIS